MFPRARPVPFRFVARHPATVSEPAVRRGRRARDAILLAGRAPSAAPHPATASERAVRRGRRARDAAIPRAAQAPSIAPHPATASARPDRPELRRRFHHAEPAALTPTAARRHPNRAVSPHRPWPAPGRPPIRPAQSAHRSAHGARSRRCLSSAAPRASAPCAPATQAFRRGHPSAPQPACAARALPPRAETGDSCCARRSETACSRAEEGAPAKCCGTESAPAHGSSRRSAASRLPTARSPPCDRELPCHGASALLLPNARGQMQARSALRAPSPPSRPSAAWLPHPSSPTSADRHRASPRRGEMGRCRERPWPCQLPLSDAAASVAWWRGTNPSRSRDRRSSATQPKWR